MALTKINVDAAIATISDEMPKMQRPGRKAVITLDDDYRYVLSFLKEGDNAALAVQPLSDDADKAKEEKAEVVGTVTAWNRIAKREKLPYVFHIRTIVENGSKSITVYGRWPNADEVQNGDNDQVVANSDEEASSV